jgi:hypothetical protein
LAKKPVGQNWQGVFLRLLDDARPKAQEEHSVAPVFQENVPGKQGKQSAN